MPLNPSELSSLISGNCNSFGLIGENIQSSSNAISQGIVNGIIGKSFQTVDAGLTPGTGAGAGIGIQGLQPSALVNYCKNLAIQGFGGTQGINLEPWLNAIFIAVVQHLSVSANLTSVHAIVFQGIGTLIVGSVPIVPEQISNTIRGSTNYTGINWQPFCDAISRTVQYAFTSMATGNVVITGSPTSPTPVQGAGAGTGFIS